MRCVLHAGMHKTGTTSIQHALSRELGGQRSFRYIDLGNPNHSAPLATAFRASPETLHYCRDARRDPSRVPLLRQTLLQRLDEELSQTDDTAVLSAEELSNFEVPELGALRDRILQHADSIDVIIYLRPIRSEVMSRFQQRTKAIRKGFGHPPPVKDYRGPLTRLDAVFGRAAVRVRRYEPSELLNGCAVQDFCAIARLPRVSPLPERMNRSLNRTSLAFLYISRWHDATHSPQRLPEHESPRTLSELSHLPGPPAAFANSILRAASAVREQDLDWVEDRIGFSLRDGLHEPDPAHAIASLEDLLQIDQSSLDWLARQSGSPTLGDADDSIRMRWIADAMHRFRQRHG